MHSNWELFYAEMWTIDWWWKPQSTFLMLSEIVSTESVWERTFQREYVRGRTCQRVSESDCQREHVSKHVRKYVRDSVSNGSRVSLRVRVQVHTEPLPNWRSWFSIQPNRQSWYGSMEISQPVWIGRVVRGSPSGSIYRFTLGSCWCSLIIVAYQNPIFNSQ